MMARQKVLLWNGTYEISDDTFSGNVYERADRNLGHRSILQPSKMSVPNEKDEEEVKSCSDDTPADRGLPPLDFEEEKKAGESSRDDEEDGDVVADLAESYAQP